MFKRITFSTILFVLFVAGSTPARADVFTQLFIEGSMKLVGAAIKGTVNTVAEAVAKKETAEEKIARRQAEIENAAEQILQQYPEDQRDAMRSQVIEKLAMTQAQYETMEARQKTIAAEQNSVGAVITSTAVGAVTSAVGSRVIIDTAARGAMIRSRF